MCSWETQFISPAGQKATQSLPLFGCTTSKSHAMSPGVAKVSKHRALQCLPVITKAVSHNVKEKKKKEMVIPWVIFTFLLTAFSGGHVIQVVFSSAFGIFHLHL